MGKDLWHKSTGKTVIKKMILQVIGKVIKWTRRDHDGLFW